MNGNTLRKWVSFRLSFVPLSHLTFSNKFKRLIESFGEMGWGGRGSGACETADN